MVSGGSVFHVRWVRTILMAFVIMNQFESVVFGFLIALGWRYVLAIYLGESGGRWTKTDRWLFGLGFIFALMIVWRRLI